MWIVKLGGSLFNSPVLPQWLHILGRYGCRRVVIVPGGGPFANHIREAQKIRQFSDSCAHRMALRAMDQFGLMLSGMAERHAIELNPVGEVEELKVVLDDGQVPVWLPAMALDHEQTIMQNWDVTSDSLAAWLAGKLQAERLILIKHLQRQSRRFEELERENVIDKALKGFARAAGFTTSCIAANQPQMMLRLLEKNDASALIDIT